MCGISPDSAVSKAFRWGTLQEPTERIFGKKSVISKAYNTLGPSTLDPAGVFGESNTLLGKGFTEKADFLKMGAAKRAETSKYQADMAAYQKAENRNNRLRAIAAEDKRTILGG